MQHLKLFSAILFSSFLFYSCTGNTNVNAGKERDSIASSGTTASTSDASFSYKIDGKEISSSEKSEMENVAVNLIGQRKGKVLFSLSDLKQNASGGVNTLSFIVPAQQGSVAINSSNSTPGLDDYLLEDTNYVPDSVTINISSVSTTKIAGTFSGKYGIPSGAGYSKILEITDGKFDIPFSTSENFIKMTQNTSK